jgi:hypothetical protein
MGAFHTGVEIHGKEYSYGYNDSPAHTGTTRIHALIQYLMCVNCYVMYIGVFISEPRTVPNALYRTSVLIGWTNLSSREVDELIDSLKPDYLGLDYHILNR